MMAMLLCLATSCATDMQKYKETRISIEITSQTGTHTFTAKLVDNSSAEAFIAALQKAPVTVQMHDYGDFEKVGSLGFSLPRNDSRITTEPGDMILYQGNQITIYYDTNTWNFTRLGKIEGITPSELRSILGKSDVKAVFSIIE